MRLLIEKPTPLPVIDDNTFDRLIKLYPNDTGWGDHPPRRFLEPLQRHGFLPFGLVGPVPDQFDMMRMTETETLEEALEYGRLAVALLSSEIGEPEESYDLDADGSDREESMTPFLAQWSDQHWELTLIVNRPSALTIGASVVFVLRRKSC